MKKRLIVPVIILLAIVGWVARDQWRQSHPGPMALSGTIEADDISIGSKIGGRVVEVLAEEGESVAAGQLLVRLDRDELETDMAYYEARLDESLAFLAERESGSRVEDIAAAAATVNQRIADLDTARATYERLTSLEEEGAVSGQEIDDARGSMESAIAALEAAHQRHEELVQGPRSEEIDRARAQVAQDRAQVAEVEVDFSETEITAPSNAVVEVLDLEVGDLIAPREIFGTLILPDSLWVRVYAPEDRLGWVSLGQTVTARVDSWPGEDFHGEVTQINRVAEYYPRNVQTVTERLQQVFGVRVRLDNAGDRLRAGMHADVTFPSSGAEPPR